jgi:hypothetical protein
LDHTNQCAEKANKDSHTEVGGLGLQHKSAVNISFSNKILINNLLTKGNHLAKYISSK